jgi:hypothetical protein
VKSIRRAQPGVQGPYSTGDVEAHAASGNDATGARIERGNTTDRKAVTPVSIGHGVYRAGKTR